MVDILSRDEINALIEIVDGKKTTQEKLNGAGFNSDSDGNNFFANDSHKNHSISDEELDVLGEIVNISMGTVATTLCDLLGEKVYVSPSSVKLMNWESASKTFAKPCVGIKVDYTGIKGANVLLVKEYDIKIMSALTKDENIRAISKSKPLSEEEVNAFGEVMSEMLDSSSTSLSSMMKMEVGSHKPKAILIDIDDKISLSKFGFELNEEVAKISFKIVVGDIINSEITQVIPMTFVEDMMAAQSIEKIDKIKDAEQIENVKDIGEIEETKQLQSVQTNKFKELHGQESNLKVSDSHEIDLNIKSKKELSIIEKVFSNLSDEDLVDMIQNHKSLSDDDLNVSDVYFETLEPVDSVGSDENIKGEHLGNFGHSETKETKSAKENMGRVLDIPVEITVEFGRAKKTIQEILEFSKGTIIELDKLVDEPVDVFVNDKCVAKGEVVVIDENFGIRITDIINIENRF